MPNDKPPDWLAGSPLFSDAYGLAAEAHHGQRRVVDTEIGHPLAVAELLHRAGFGEEVVAAALLHDVVEDTTVELEEISEAFGREICVLVREMTEDPGIEEYADRKAEHRARIVKNRHVAATYAADKVEAGGSTFVARRRM